MGNLFDIDNPIMHVISRAVDFVALNILFVVLCIPIITIGPAITAMYYVLMKVANKEEPYIYRNFFKAFKQNFLQSTAIWLAMLLMIAVLAADLFFVNTLPIKWLAFVIRCVVFFVGMATILTALYVFPVQAKFENKIRYTIKNAFILAVANLVRTAILLVVSGLTVFVITRNVIIMSYGILFFLIVGFTLILYLNSYILVPVFEKITTHVNKDGEENELPDHTQTISELDAKDD